MTDQPPAAASPPAPHPRARAKAHRTHATSTLDNILVVGSLVIVAGVLLGLFIAAVPQANLPVIAGVTGTLVGTVIGGYAGYRWGASETMKAQQQDAAAE